MPSQSNNWLKRSQAAVWHPCTQMQHHETLPIVPIRRGEGVYLEDFDGNRYIDAVSSWWVNLFGHNEPRIKAAIKDQLDELEHAMLAGFTHQPVVELSERLAKLSGLGHAFYGSDGASATEIALKMSFHYWYNVGKPNKKRFVCLENSYHGETVGALAVTDVPIFSETYAPLIQQGAIRAPSPDARLAQAGESAADVALRAAQSLENILAKHHDEIAALIVEPLVQGAAGMVMYDPIYLKRARELCDQYQVHLIADEIAMGFGRTGRFFAHQQAGIRPDLMCLSKGITGGYLPLSCVLCTDAIYQAFYDADIRKGFLHSHSYTGNALACRAALAVLDIFEQDKVIQSNQQKSQDFSVLFEELAHHPKINHFRNKGMIWAMEVDTLMTGFSRHCFQAMLARGCLVRPIGNTVYFMPPYTIQKNEIIILKNALLDTLSSLAI